MPTKTEIVSAAKYIQLRLKSDHAPFPNFQGDKESLQIVLDWILTNPEEEITKSDILIVIATQLDNCTILPGQFKWQWTWVRQENGHQIVCGRFERGQFPDTVTSLLSRDNLLRILEKQSQKVKEDFIPLLDMEIAAHKEGDKIKEVYAMINAQPIAIARALLKATGLWPNIKTIVNSVS